MSELWNAAAVGAAAGGLPMLAMVWLYALRPAPGPKKPRKHVHDWGLWERTSIQYVTSLGAPVKRVAGQERTCTTCGHYEREEV